MKIKYTTKGQPYVILKSGKARFLSKTKKKFEVRKKMKRRTYHRNTNTFNVVNKSILGAMGVIAYEGLISPMIPLQGTAKDLLELAGGLYLSKKKGFLGATGKSLIVLNAYQLLSGLVGTRLFDLLQKKETSSYEYEVI